MLLEQTDIGRIEDFEEMESFYTPYGPNYRYNLIIGDECFFNS